MVSTDEIGDVLERVREKSLRGSLAPLGQWEDQRLFESVAQVLKE